LQNIGQALSAYAMGHVQNAKQTLNQSFNKDAPLPNTSFDNISQLCMESGNARLVALRVWDTAGCGASFPDSWAMQPKTSARP
jgi:hypothetical protein